MWIEGVASALKLRLVNLAVADATTGAFNTSLGVLHRHGCRFTTDQAAEPAVRLTSLADCCSHGMWHAGIPKPFGYVNHTTEVPVPGALAQAKAYIKSNKGQISARDVYVIAAGVNDVFGAVLGHGNVTTEESVSALRRTATNLHTAGARTCAPCCCCCFRSQLLCFCFAFPAHRGHSHVRSWLWLGLLSALAEFLSQQAGCSLRLTGVCL